jgi:hypothetical protein
MEHQLKLHSESLQLRIDELEKELIESNNKNQTITDVNEIYVIKIKLLEYFYIETFPNKKNRS